MPEPASYESASDFAIKSVRLIKDGSEVNIAPLVGQLEIFENLQYPFLTGKLFFKDDANIYETFSFNGTEICEITLTQPSTSPIDIKKTFIIRSVLDTQKLNDMDEVISLYLIEKISFDGSLQRFSKSYSGTPLEIINKIAKEKLDIIIDQPLVKPVQKPMKVVIPGMTPLEAIAFIMERMTTEDGLPYYFYSCLNEDNLRITSLEEMLNEEAFNKDTPYRYSKAYAQDETNNASNKNPFIVKTYSAGSGGSENTMGLQFGGAIAGSFSVTDLTTGRNEKSHFDIHNVFLRLMVKNVIPLGSIPNLDLKYDGKELQTFNSVQIHRAVAVNTYDNINNYYQEESLDQYQLAMVRIAIQQLFFKYFINLTVPGVPFLLGAHNSIGKQIEYLHLANDLESTEEKTASEDKMRDRKRSGNYMISAAHHVFFDTKHTVEMSAVRLGMEQA